MVDSEASIVAVVRLQVELARLFQEARQTFAGGPPVATASLPLLDVLEHEDRVVVVMELPDVAADALSVEVRHDVVTVRGTRSPCPLAAGNEATTVRFLRVERPHGAFERRIDLGGLGRPINSHQGRARLAAGVLTIEFPRVAERRARPLAVLVEEIA